MAFKVRCPKCQKVYAAETQWIGKRIRCKACGEGFIVDQPAEDFPVQPAAATQVAPPTSAKSKPSESVAGRSSSRVAAAPPKNVEETDDAFAMRGDEYPGLRASVPQDFPMANVIEAWLPLALGLIATVLCASQIVSQNETGRTWVSILRFALVALLYFLLIVPLTYKAIATSFLKLRRILPPNPYARVAATFALPAAFAVVFWQGIGGIGGVSTGVIIGLILMAAVFWLLFRLTPPEAANSYAWAAGMFIGGTIASALIIMGLSFGINRAMMAAHATDYRESPLGAQLAWTNPEPAPIKKLVDPAPPTQTPLSNTAVASNTNDAKATNKQVKSTPMPVVKESPTDSSPTSTGATPISESIQPPSPPVTAITNAATPPPATPDPAPLFANPDDDQFVVNLRKKSLPFVKQVTRANSQGPFDFVIGSMGTGPYIGMVTLDPNAVAMRRFSVGYLSDAGMRRTPTVEITDGAGTPRSFARNYFLTPDGAAVLHVQAYDIQVIHVGQKDHDTIPLTMPIRQTTASITPQIVGLGRDKSVVVRWSGPSSIEQFVQRYSYSSRKLLEAGNMVNCSVSSDATAVSSNAEGPVWFASVITHEGNRPSLALYNASTAGGSGKNTQLPTELSDISHYDADISFSPSATKLVLLLSDSDHTLIYQWITANIPMSLTATTPPSMRLSLPPLPASVTTGHVVGPRVRWIDDLVFVVDAQTVVGTYPNRAGVLGKLSDSPGLATINTAKDQVLVTYAAEDGFCHASQIDFDPTALKAAMPIKEPAAAH